MRSRDQRLANGDANLPGPVGPHTDPRHSAGHQPDLHSVGVSGTVACPHDGSEDRPRTKLGIVACFARRVLELPASWGALQQRAA